MYNNVPHHMTPSPVMPLHSCTIKTDILSNKNHAKHCFKYLLLGDFKIEYKDQICAVSVCWCYWLLDRCVMVSTDQADPIRYYFRISWILMERCWFHFFLSPLFSAGPQKPPTLTKNLDSSLKNRYSSVLIFQEREFFDL